MCYIWIHILLSVFHFIFHHRHYSFSFLCHHFFCVCFVFCSCHLLWFHLLLNLLGITQSCFGVFLIKKTEVLWLRLKHFLTSVEVSVEFHCCWLDFCKAFCRAASCFLKLGSLPLLFSDLSPLVSHWGTIPVIAGAVIQWNQTRRAHCPLSSCICKEWLSRATIFLFESSLVRFLGGNTH